MLYRIPEQKREEKNKVTKDIIDEEYNLEDLSQCDIDKRDVSLVFLIDIFL